ncbi:MAG TPA: DNA methyltransferase [Polyangiaceae bacterium]|jgi:hypothetical protein|nr:DNA methyltransferase [Polyangiaceae bacterium]
MNTDALAPPAAARAPTRTVVHADALDWLGVNAPLEGCSIITSLPDVSELSGMRLDAWQDWFVGAARSCLSALPDRGIAIFFQSDIRHEGVWIDKGALVTRAASETGAALLFHKIVCRKPAGTITLGRASYSHMLAFSRAVRSTPLPGKTTADVLSDAGFMPGNKSMGVKACLDACRFVQRETESHTIVDPFCGFGTVLAVANQLGLAAIGVDLSKRMCRRARTLELDLSAL